MQLLWRAGALLGTTLLLSCGAGRGEACARYAAARCARLSACGQLEAQFADETICQQRIKLDCAAELGAPQTGATSTSLARCAEALPDLACEQLDGDVCAPPQGRLPAGSQCRYHSQCSSAHCTVPDHSPCGVCEPAPQVGDSCDVDCAPLVCDPITWSCAMPVVAGAACGVGRPCGLAQQCLIGDGGSDGACQPSSPILAADAADDDLCDVFAGPLCLFPSHCVLDGTSRGGGVCTPPDPRFCASGVPDNPLPPSGPFTPGAHDSSLVVPYQHGPIQAAPELITITWADYPLADDVHAFGSWIVGSDWLRAAGKDYGVGLGTHVEVRLPSPAPASLTDDDLRKQLAAWQADSTLPPAGPSTLYMVYLNQGMQFSGFFGLAACIDYLGYHDETSQPPATSCTASPATRPRSAICAKGATIARAISPTSGSGPTPPRSPAAIPACLPTRASPTFASRSARRESSL